MMRRRLHHIFRLALVSVLTLGWFMEQSWVERYKAARVPVEVSDEEMIEDGCNVLEGRWVWDNASNPLYGEEKCPFLVKQTTCVKNGRPDSLYQNTAKLMEMLRDGRPVFVGDSIQRGLFESIVCLVQSAIPSKSTSILKTFLGGILCRDLFPSEGIADCTKQTKRRIPPRKVFKVEQRLEWSGVDILIFESHVWWMYKPVINATYGSTDELQEFNVTTAYRLALGTWANWIEPTLILSWLWKPGTDGNCFNETHPTERPYWGTGSSLDTMRTLQDVISQLKVKVRVSNITQLSEFRKDARTSFFGERRGKLLTREQRSDPKNFADCIH